METITIILAIALAVFCVYIVVGNYRQDTLFSFMVRRKTLNKYLVCISGKNKEISKSEGRVSHLLNKCRELRSLNAKLQHDAERNMAMHHQQLLKLRKELNEEKERFECRFDVPGNR